MNKVILVGFLGRDPEVKYAANGNAIANLSVATSEEWNDKSSGQKQQKTEWHKIVVYGKLAEIAGQYLTKGSQVYLEGKLQTRKWQDQNTGQDRFSTEVVIDFNGQMQMLGGGNRQGDAAFGQAPSGMSSGVPPMGQQAPQGGQGFAPQGQMGFNGQQQQTMQGQAPMQQNYPESGWGDDQDVPF